MIRFLNAQTVAGYRFGKGAIVSLNSASEDMLVAGGDAEVIDVSAAHPYCHFHGFAGNQTVGDGKFFDLAGINHGLRGVNLSDSAMFTTAGYVSTVDPAGGALDSSIHIPSVNFDYTGGEKLIVWWLGTGTPEAVNVPIMGDGWGNAGGQRGWRVRMTADGKFDISLLGATSGFSSASHAVVFDGTLHSAAFCLDGTAKTHGLWADDVYHPFFGSSLLSFNPGASFDTLSTNTVNLGSSRPATAATTEGAAIKIRALVIVRLPAGYAMPSVATLTKAFAQLRANPGKLILASAF